MKDSSFLRYTMCIVVTAFASCARPSNCVTQTVTEVSLISLLAFPQNFNGKNVAVIGFYHRAGVESAALYTSPDDARIQNIQSSLWIAGYEDGRIVCADSIKRQDRYIGVSGMFNCGPTGHLGLWPGMIYPVYSISVFDEATKKWVVEKTRKPDSAINATRDR